MYIYVAYIYICMHILRVAGKLQCCSALQGDAVCCSVLHCGASRCSVLQCVAVCCSVFQCVSVLTLSLGTQTHCNALQHAATYSTYSTYYNIL